MGITPVLRQIRSCARRRPSAWSPSRAPRLGAVSRLVTEHLGLAGALHGTLKRASCADEPAKRQEARKATGRVPPVIGVVLAGGSGRRLGRGSKAAVVLAGRPLVSYPVSALGEEGDRIAMVSKRSTALPELSGVERWDEPDGRVTRSPGWCTRSRPRTRRYWCAPPTCRSDGRRLLDPARSGGRRAGGGDRGGGHPPARVALYAPPALETLAPRPRTRRSRARWRRSSHPRRRCRPRSCVASTLPRNWQRPRRCWPRGAQSAG